MVNDMMCKVQKDCSRAGVVDQVERLQPQQLGSRVLCFEQRRDTSFCVGEDGVAMMAPFTFLFFYS